jgi:hypothetical protein
MARTCRVGLSEAVTLAASAEADPDLLVLVAVLGNDAPGVELDHAERDPIAVHDPSVHSLQILCSSSDETLPNALTCR